MFSSITTTTISAYITIALVAYTTFISPFIYLWTIN